MRSEDTDSGLRPCLTQNSSVSRNRSALRGTAASQVRFALHSLTMSRNRSGHPNGASSPTVSA
jgi:hypothetical protein